ncbi:MAG: aminomethyl-transferring glycine dehydrogenase subunit GcvPA [Halobacteriaceae archaeon]
MSGSPYAPHDDADREAMLAAVGAADVEALFDVPESVRFDGQFGIDAASEHAVRDAVTATLGANDDLVEFLGRGHYAHNVPAVVDQLSQRSEFITSYTQYQPEITQGFLQALFEYQSLIVELTGLDVANCSMYDAATALGEAVRLADRVRAVDGDTVLLPATMRAERRSVVENYVAGTDLTLASYPTTDGTVDPDALADRVDADTLFVYADSPSVRGTIATDLDAVGDLTTDNDALFCLGSDPIALAVLERPVDVGADVVVGDAASLGLGTAYGMGLGMFATRETFLRQVPGRLVGAGTDEAGTRAYTLTLQTREQHIRRERATSNICTNQAWLALRAAIHAAWLGPDGLVDLAETCITEPRALAAAIDDIDGLHAPVDDAHHFREFVVSTDRPATAIREALLEAGFAVHAIADHELQVCVTDATATHTDALLDALREVAT